MWSQAHRVYGSSTHTQMTGLAVAVNHLTVTGRLTMIMTMIMTMIKPHVAPLG